MSQKTQRQMCICLAPGQTPTFQEAHILWALNLAVKQKGENLAKKKKETAMPLTITMLFLVLNQLLEFGLPGGMALSPIESNVIKMLNHLW